MFQSTKIKLNEVEYEIITGIAQGLNLPKEEVLAVCIHLGQLLMLLRENDTELRDLINAQANVKEYKNWDKIATAFQQCYKEAIKIRNEK